MTEVQQEDFYTEEELLRAEDELRREEQQQQQPISSLIVMDNQQEQQQQQQLQQQQQHQEEEPVVPAAPRTPPFAQIARNRPKERWHWAFNRIVQVGAGCCHIGKSRRKLVFRKNMHKIMPYLTVHLDCLYVRTRTVYSCSSNVSMLCILPAPSPNPLPS